MKRLYIEAKHSTTSSQEKEASERKKLWTDFALKEIIQLKKILNLALILYLLWVINNEKTMDKG